MARDSREIRLTSWVRIRTFSKASRISSKLLAMPLEAKGVEWALTYSFRTNNLNPTAAEAEAVAGGATSACLRSQLIIQSTLQIIQ